MSLYRDLFFRMESSIVIEEPSRNGSFGSLLVDVGEKSMSFRRGSLIVSQSSSALLRRGSMGGLPPPPPTPGANPRRGSATGSFGLPFPPELVGTGGVGGRNLRKAMASSSSKNTVNQSEMEDKEELSKFLRKKVGT